jgi:FtsZ-binding cell division protein ZapB
MQTIEEYKAYTRQLENEVGKWHHAYDALMVERNQLVNRLMELEQEINGLKIKNEIIQKSHDATVQELNDLINKTTEDK